jgi:undecaprenyl-diphosphatase
MINDEIFYTINSLSKIPFWANLSLFLSYFFTYILIFLLIIFFIFFGKRKMYNFSLLFLSGIFSWILANIFKNIFSINRPFIDLNIAPLYSEVGYSFPSVHMTVLTAISFIVFSLNKKIGIIFFMISIITGVSRIIIGVHYPLDILGGLILGLIVSFSLIKIFKQI